MLRNILMRMSGNRPAVLRRREMAIIFNIHERSLYQEHRTLKQSRIRNGPITVRELANMIIAVKRLYQDNPKKMEMILSWLDPVSMAYTEEEANAEGERIVSELNKLWESDQQ